MGNGRVSPPYIAVIKQGHPVHVEEKEPPLNRGVTLPCRGGILSSWLWEIGAVLLSIVLMAAVIVLLSRENGRPLTAWTARLSLNTIIAILGTVSRTSLLFAVG